MNSKLKFVLKSCSEQDTLKIAEEFALNLKENDIVILSGNLGAGKTVFTKGVAQTLGVNSDSVASPSFTLLNRYKSPDKNLYHIDFYRLPEGDDIFFDEVEEVMNSGGITLIEWGEKFLKFLDEYAEGKIYNVRIVVSGLNNREISIEENPGH